MFPDRKKIALNHPLAGREKIEGHKRKPLGSVLILVLDDAAHRDIGHGEGLRRKFESPALENRFVEGLAGELHDGAVGMNGPRLQLGQKNQKQRVFLERYRHISGSARLQTFFVKDLDASIVELRQRVVIDKVSVIKPHSVSARMSRPFFLLQTPLVNGNPVLTFTKLQYPRAHNTLQYSLLPPTHSS